MKWEVFDKQGIIISEMGDDGKKGSSQKVMEEEKLVCVVCGGEE